MTTLKHISFFFILIYFNWIKTDWVIENCLYLEIYYRGANYQWMNEWMNEWKKSLSSGTSASHTISLICLDSNVMCQGKCAYFGLQLDTSGISSDTGHILYISNIYCWVHYRQQPDMVDRCLSPLSTMFGWCSGPSATPSRVPVLLGYLVLTVPHSELKYPLIPSHFPPFFCTGLTGNTIRHPLIFTLLFIAFHK